MAVSRLKYVLIQKQDQKTNYWAAALKKYNVVLIPLKGSPIKWATFYCKQLILKKPKAIIFRYLNDYPSFIKTLLRFLSEGIVLLLAPLFGTKIIWLCHNINRETDVHFPIISDLRRKYIVSKATKIFVMDKLLVSEARHRFPPEKVDFLSFGIILSKKKDKHIIRSINKFVSNNTKENVVFGLVIGSINYKTLHFEKIPELLAQNSYTRKRIKLVVGGPIGAWLERYNPSLLEYLQKSEDVYFVDQYIHFEPSDIENVGFIFKSNTDLSVPLSYYSAAQSQIPILAIEQTFSAEFVDHYNIGRILYNDLSNLDEVLYSLPTEQFSYKKFLDEKSWDAAAFKISKHL